MSNEFRIPDLANALDRARLRWSRILLIVVVLFGIGIAATGIALVDGAPMYTFGSSTLLLVGGVLMAAAGTLGYSRVPRAAVELVVHSEHLRFRDARGRVSEMGWDEPEARIEISDWRSVPMDQKSAELKTIDFVVDAHSGFIAAVPLEAVRRILEVARANGMTVTGWVEHASSPGPERVIRVAAIRRD